jgi:hypothetical protein
MSEANVSFRSGKFLSSFLHVLPTIVFEHDKDLLISEQEPVGILVQERKHLLHHGMNFDQKMRDEGCAGQGS